jgi:hypothetical protein
MKQDNFNFDTYNLIGKVDDIIQLRDDEPAGSSLRTLAESWIDSAQNPNNLYNFFLPPPPPPPAGPAKRRCIVM